VFCNFQLAAVEKVPFQQQFRSPLYLEHRLKAKVTGSAILVATRGGFFKNIFGRNLRKKLKTFNYTFVALWCF
jgi:hypothetical protein